MQCFQQQRYRITRFVVVVVVVRFFDLFDDVIASGQTDRNSRWLPSLTKTRNE